MSRTDDDALRKDSAAHAARKPLTADAAARAVACFGGTFDPFHRGHLQVAEAARLRFGFAEIRVLPAADPPLRAAPGASALQRLAMVRLGVEGRPGFRVDDRELQRAGPSYTIDTLTELRAEFGEQRPLVWMLGADALARIDRWHRWESLLQVAHLLVLDRPDTKTPVHLDDWCARHRCDDATAIHRSPAGQLFFFPGPLVAISATRIRASCAAGGAPSADLPSAVWTYIRAQRLYGAAADSATVGACIVNRGDPH